MRRGVRGNLVRSLVATTVAGLLLASLPALPVQAAHVSPTVLATVATPGGLPLGLGVNSTTNKVYVAVRDESGQGRLVVINGATNAVLYDPPSLVGRNPSSVAVNEVTNKAYVVNNVSLAPTDPAISVVNGADDTITHIPDSVVHPGQSPAGA